MDRLEFSKSINGIEVTVQAVDCFNEIMTMFNLINRYDIEYIEGHIQENNSITFDINFKSSSDADEVSKIMVSERLTVYDEDYSLNNIKNTETSVTIILTRL